MPATASLPSKVGTSPFAALLRSIFDLVLQVARLMIAAELAQRCFVELKKNLAHFFGFRIIGCETLSVNLTQRADKSISMFVADFAVVVAVAIVETCLAHDVHRVPLQSRAMRVDQATVHLPIAAGSHHHRVGIICPRNLRIDPHIARLTLLSPGR
jgi:hypothetical protein